MKTPTIHTINPALIHTAFGIFNTVPESPDRSHIAYVSWPEPPKDGKECRPLDLWVCNRDLSNHRLLCRLPGEASNHNGVDIIWVTNDLIATQTKDPFDSISTIQAVDATTGDIVWGPIRNARLGHHAWQQKLLVGKGRQTDPEQFGVYEVDGLTGAMTHLMGADSLAAACPELVAPSDVNPVHDWGICHCQHSTDGSHILFRLDVHGTSKQKLLISMRADGSDIIKFSTSKPLHQLWYDGNTIMGHDRAPPEGHGDRNRCARWDRHGNYLETLAGFGNHLGVSLDRRLYASETMYYKAPVVFRLYARGETTPFQTVFSTDLDHAVWQNRCHTNPSFSTDNKRLYFCMPVAHDRAQASFIDLDDIGS